MIVTQQARSHLPGHKPPTLSGDVTPYLVFITAFEILIESRMDNPSERLYFLGEYTGGKAKELTTELGYMNFSLSLRKQGTP